MSPSGCEVDASARGYHAHWVVDAGSSGDTAPELSVIIPTRNEAGNIAELVRQLDANIGALHAEILFVDDSDDDTPIRIGVEVKSATRRVRLLHRPDGHREGGLGGAVATGLRLMQARWAVVMDGDLQHPPEVVRELFHAATEGAVDLVVATRYDGVGGAEGLSSRARSTISVACTRIARVIFPRRLRDVTDPMSGFFAVRRAALDLDRLRPCGYKVLLEILAGQRLVTCEVPYKFQPRFAGESKASSRQGLLFLRRLLWLRVAIWLTAGRQLAEFFAVGATGTGVNTVVLLGLSGPPLRIHYLFASAIATQVAVGWNFLLVDRLVFRQARHGYAWLRLMRFWLLNMMLLPVQLGLLALLVSGLAWPTGIANILVLGAVFLVRYLVSANWIYFGAADGSSTAQGRWPQAAASVCLSSAVLRHVPSWPRFALPVLLTLAAFPNVVQVLAGTTPDRSVGGARICFVAAMVATVGRLRGRQGEPEVHDRQLDVIIALPLLGTTAWLSLNWATVFGLHDGLSDREIVAAVAFLAGACVLILGTRALARLRVPLFLSLAAMPTLSIHPFVPVLVSVLAVATVGRTLVVPARRKATLGERGLAFRHTPQRWPAARFATLTLAVAALALGVHSALADTSPSGTRPHVASVVSSDLGQPRH